MLNWISAYVVLALPAVSGTSLPQAIPKLTALAESLDGLQADIAGPTDASSLPGSLRTWFAQGRRRMSVDVETRARELSEEELGFDSGIQAVELDEGNALLFTLTDLAAIPGEPVGYVMPELWVQAVPTPDTPGLPLVTVLDDGLAPGIQYASDVRVLDPVAKHLLVISKGSLPSAVDPALYVLDYSNPGSLSVVATATFDAGLVPLSPCALGYGSLLSAEVHDIPVGPVTFRYAFCRISMAHTGSTKPFSTGIVVCDLTVPSAPQLADRRQSGVRSDALPGDWLRNRSRRAGPRYR